MNIFCLEGINNLIDFRKSAQSLDNLRISKMIVESCQLMSTALNQYGAKELYKSFNPKHPCCLWVAESSENFCNVMEHCSALLTEYFKRYKKKSHSCINIYKKCYQQFSQFESQFPHHKTTPFKMAMPKEFQNSNDVVGSYRNYFAQKDNVIYPIDKIPEWFIVLRGPKPFSVKTNDGEIIKGNITL